MKHEIDVKEDDSTIRFSCSCGNYESMCSKSWHEEVNRLSAKATEHAAGQFDIHDKKKEFLPN